MSQLQSIASRLRALAQDATPLSANVEASARQLKALGQQVESLGRAGVDVGPLVAALRAAEAQAHAAARAAAQVKADGVTWADDLARGGQGTMTSDSKTSDRSAAPPRLTPREAYLDLAGKFVKSLASQDVAGTVLPFVAGQVGETIHPAIGEAVEVATEYFIDNLQVNAVWTRASAARAFQWFKRKG